MTRQLLAFSRRQALVPERIDLRERLPSLRELLQPLLGPSIDLQIDVAPDTVLSQVRALAQSAGGDAIVESRPGEGTCVKLYFHGGELPAAAAESHRGAAIDNVHCRVLLVEDNEAVAEATLLMLREMGCETVRVGSAGPALKHLDDTPGNTDVVLSDIEMPGGMDGIALASAVYDRHPTLRVILMSGYAERLEQAIQQNLEVLPKPAAPT